MWIIHNELIIRMCLIGSSHVLLKIRKRIIKIIRHPSLARDLKIPGIPTPLLVTIFHNHHRAEGGFKSGLLYGLHLTDPPVFDVPLADPDGLPIRVPTPHESRPTFPTEDLS